MKEDDLLQLRGWSPEDEVQIKLQWCTVHVSTDYANRITKMIEFHSTNLKLRGLPV